MNVTYRSYLREVPMSSEVRKNFQDVTGYLNSIQSANGWTTVPTSEPWTYASSTTINVPTGGATSRYAIGQKIKITQPTLGTKYFYVTGVSSALLTVSAGSDYSVANEAISTAFYSSADAPLGFPDWFNTTAPTFDVATIDNASGGQPTTAVSRFKISGRTACVFLSGSGTKAGAGIYFTFNPSVYPTEAMVSYSHTYGSASAICTGAGTLIGAIITSSGTEWSLVYHSSISDNDPITAFSSMFCYQI